MKDISDKLMAEEQYALMRIMLHHKFGSKSDDRINRKLKQLAFANRLKDYAVNNVCFIEESGMDCDCTKYSGHIHKIEPTLEAYYALEDGIGEWADGPFYLRLVTVEEAQQIRPHSRDLALEAFEDGHPHIVYA